MRSSVKSGGRVSGKGNKGRELAAPGLDARRVAAQAVGEVLREGLPLDDILEREGRALESRDAGLARAIAIVTFRRFGTIRQALLERLAKAPPKDQRLLALLATGAAQILFLNVPDHAAVDLAVRLAREDKKLAHLAGVINAVLRRIVRERDAILAEADAPGQALRLDTPAWLTERWIAAYGEARAAALALTHREGASVDVSVKADPAAWAERLGGALLPGGSVRLPESGEIASLPGYADGEWWVQDAGAALPARLLVAKPGERVADLCAAPGGKTAQLASAGAKVTAVDRSERRLMRLAENMERLRLSVATEVADLLDYEAEPFDAVLLDAPCSATGTLRRHPDVAWAKAPGDVSTLAALQARLLDKAATLVRPGGRLVYCTCSLETEEGEGQTRRFLERHPEFERLAILPEEVPGLAGAITREGELRLLPDELAAIGGGKPGLDGFFAVRLARLPVEPR